MHQTSKVNEPPPAWLRPRGMLLSECPVPGCTTLTMGGTCVAHDPPVTTTFERGRPFFAGAAADAGRVPVAG